MRPSAALRAAGALTAAVTAAGCALTLAEPALPLSPGQRQILARLAPPGLADEALCARLKPALEARYESPIASCTAYPVRVVPLREAPFTAYDLVVAVPAEVMRQRDYPTNQVDPIVPELIGTRRAVQASVVITYLREGDLTVPVIDYIQPARRPRASAIIVGQGLSARRLVRPAAAPGSGLAPPVPYPTPREIAGELAEIYKGQLRARNCGDTGPACPAALPPAVSGVVCAGEANAMARCAFDVSQYGALEHCTARFERRAAGWWLVRDNSSYFAPPVLDMTCAPKTQ